MREQFRDRYLQYDDAIADHRMLWRAHALPPIIVHLVPAGVPPTDATRECELQVGHYLSSIQAGQEGVS